MKDDEYMKTLFQNFGSQIGKRVLKRCIKKMKSGFDIDAPYLTPDSLNHKKHVYLAPRSADRFRQGSSGSRGQSLI